MSETDRAEFGALNRVWVVAVVFGVLGALPAAYFRDQAPWIMAAAVAIGVAATVLLEMSGTFGQRLLLTLPGGTRSWRFYRHLLALFVQKQPEVPEVQLELQGMEMLVNKPDKRIIMLRDEKDRSLMLIEFDRFMARVTSIIGEDLGKASEYSLRTAWQRLKPLQDEYSQMEAFFKDPMVLETLKRDIAANVHTAIAKSGEQTAKFFLRELGQAEDVRQYRVVADAVHGEKKAKKHSQRE